MRIICVNTGDKFGHWYVKNLKHMIIKALILTTLLTNDPAIITMPPEKIEMRRRGGKGNKGRKRGGKGLR